MGGQMFEIIDTSQIEAASERYEDHSCNTAENLKNARETGQPDAMNALDEMPRYVNRFIQLGRPDLAARMVEKSTDGTVPVESALERVIEQNELMGVSFFERGLRAARAVCRISVRNGAGQLLGYGTGFMISPTLLMTNNHVLDSVAAATGSYAEFDYMLGVNGEEIVPKRFRLAPARFFHTSPANQLDYAITAVEPVNAEGDILADRGWIHLIASSGKAIAGEPINIIQHPSGERMQIAIRENEVLGPDGDYFIYKTDTKRGSSGSPALNDQWQVAALHHAGVPRKDDAGNWLKKDGQRFRHGIDDMESVDWIANEGIRISRIVADMTARQLTIEERALFDETFIPAPLEAMATSAPPVGGSIPPGMTIGADGMAHWDFRVSFGPIPKTVALPQTAAVAAPVSAPVIVPAPAVIPVVTSEASVFEPRGAYYDEASDLAASDGYYAGIQANLTKAKRYDALHALVRDTHQTVLSYVTARHEHLYPWIDRHEDETLKSVYSAQTMPEELFVAEMLAFETQVRVVAEAQSMEATALGDSQLEAIDAALEASSTFNCEHVVPQSWFKDQPEKAAQKSDMHHLFACEPGCNSFRGNIPYSEFSQAEEDALRASEFNLAEAMLDPTLEAARPACGLRDARRFEPTAGKGAAARATLYFVLRYPGAVGDVKSGSKKEFTKSNVGILLDWAENDPVSLYEKHRNAEISKVQGNRNPLIDHPEWLRKIAFENGFG